MTILEAIKSNENLANISDDKIKLLATIRGYDLAEVAGASSLKAIELITADLYKEILTYSDIKEGSLALTYNRGALQSFIDRVATEYADEKLKDGIIDAGITDASEKW